MDCIARAPQTTDEWFAAIDRCATMAGGSDWQSLALTGLATVAVVLAFAALVAIAFIEMSRGRDET